MHKLIVLCLFLITSPFIADEVMRSLDQSPSAQIVKKVERGDVDYLAVGSSRVSAGLDPSVLPDRFLIWQVSLMDFGMLEMLVSNQIRALKKVNRKLIIEFSLESYVTDMLTLRPDLRSNITSLGYRSWQDPSAILDFRNWKMALFFPYLTKSGFSFRQQDMAMTGPTGRQASVEQLNGFTPIDKVIPERILPLFEKQLIQQAEQGFKHIDLNVQRVNKISKTLLEANIKFCWLEMPRANGLSGIGGQVEQLVKLPDQSLLCLERNVIREFERTKPVFADGIHLQRESAKDFSKIVSQHLQ